MASAAGKDEFKLDVRREQSAATASADDTEPLVTSVDDDSGGGGCFRPSRFPNIFARGATCSMASPAAEEEHLEADETRAARVIIEYGPTVR